MTVTKTKITITIDSDICEAARNKYGNVSGRINELLSMDLYGSDEKAELVERLHNLQIEEKSITKRICELEKEEVKIQAEETNRETVLSWVADVYQRNGVIGLNLLEKECKRHHVNFEEMRLYLESEEIATVKYA